MEDATETGSADPARSRQKIPYGRVAYPAIGYKMGSRRMVTTVMSPVTYVGIVGERENWDPLQGTGTNRKEDKKHREAIARYIEETENFVLNSVLVYYAPTDAEFVADDADASISMGTLYVQPGAKAKVGDGGHRTSAYGDVIAAHQHGDEVLQRLQANGQPVIVVLDDDQPRRAQDFTDLQQNAKALNASIAQSMDRRQAINRMLLEEILKGGRVPAFDGGKRVEFLSDSPGKLSSKLMGFKALRYATGTLLVGTGVRSSRAWDEAVSVEIATAGDDALEKMIDFWNGFGALPDVAGALSVPSGVVKLRDSTWLTSANVLYALAAAVHMVTSGAQVTVRQAMKAAAGIDFARAGSTFYGTLVAPAQYDSNGNLESKEKALTGRDAWEGAAEMLATQMRAADAGL